MAPNDYHDDDMSDSEMGFQVATDDDQVPSEILSFITANGIGDKYQCVLKQLGGTRPVILNTYKNTFPEIDEVAQNWGPGRYEWFFSFKQRDPDGKVGKPLVKSYAFELGEGYRDIYEDYQYEKRRKRQEKQLKRADEEKFNATLESLRNGGNGKSEPNKDPLTMLRESLSLAKELGIPIGGNSGGNNGSAEMLQVMALMMKQQQDQAQMQNNMILALINSKSGGEGGFLQNQMQEGMGLMMKMFSQGMQIKQFLENPSSQDEKEGWVDRIFTMVEKAGPTIAALLAKSQADREKDMRYKLARSSKEFKVMENNEDILADVVTRIDKKYGCQSTDQILEGIGLNRPAATLDHYTKYPSQGFGPDGEPLQDGAAEITPSEG